MVVKFKFDLREFFKYLSNLGRNRVFRTQYLKKKNRRSNLLSIVQMCIDCHLIMNEVSSHSKIKILEEKYQISIIFL